jgi:hypothetical protein
MFCKVVFDTLPESKEEERQTNSLKGKQEGRSRRDTFGADKLKVLKREEHDLDLYTHSIQNNLSRM